METSLLSAVPFVDLKAQYDPLKEEINTAVQSVLQRGAFILGPELEEFETAFASYIGVQHCIGVSSGTDALRLALLACGIGPGHEVITTPHTFIATCEAISQVGAQIRWVDIDPRTYNLDPSQIESAITPSTKAILPVHLYGQPADMDAVMSLARKHNLMVIEDCAQAHGAKFRGRKIGTFGDAAAFSFYPAKNLGAYGDAGAVLTNRDAVADRIRLLRNHGQREKNVHELEGYCDRMDNLQAAVLGIKLRHLDQWNESRRRAAVLYDELLRDVPGVVTPHVLPEVEPVYHLYVIQTPERDRVQAALAATGVQTGVHYPIPLHQQPAYKRMGHSPGDFPVSSQLGPRILSLPMFPEISATQIETVAVRLREALRFKNAPTPPPQ